MKTLFQLVFVFAAFLFSQSLPIHAQTNLSTGLVAYYPFNGNANDVSGNGNNGIVYGATLTSDRFGNPNCAYLFDGVSSYIRVPNSSSLQLTNDFTVCAWINCPSLSATGDIVTKHMAGPENLGTWALRLTGYDTIDFEATPWFGYYTYSGPVSLGAWHQVVFNYVRTNFSWCIYIDGVLNSGGTHEYDIQDNTNDMHIGVEPNPDLPLGVEAFFNGRIDDVRIYSRALSSPEIMSLYTLSYLGPQPQPPQIVQTNRSPTKEELGGQTNGVLEMLVNGYFTNVFTMDTTKSTIVLTHGWRSCADDWALVMDQTLNATLGAEAANIVAWNWPTNASSPPWDPWEAGAKTLAEGKSLGASLINVLGQSYSQPIHFIGHSFGTIVNASAADYLQTNGYSWTNMQMTLFDEAEVGTGPNTSRNIAITITALNANDSASQPFWYRPLPNHFIWADNYITAFGLLHPIAANIILTNSFPVPTDDIFELFNELLSFHDYPIYWYDDSISGPFQSSMGFRWSFEEDALNPPPSTNTYYIQSANASDLDLIATDLPTATQKVNSRLHNMLTQIEYTVVVAAPAVLQAANQVSATIQDLTPQDPYAFTTGLPDGWGLGVILATSASSSGTLVGPQLKKRPFSSTANDSNAPTNLPAFVWIPLEVPSNAVSMSFDFALTGDGMSDSFAVALNGTNVFLVLNSLLQNNVTMNSGPIDVSAYSGTNIDLFLGIVGGTSTNANILASGFRFYSVVPPVLQAQQSENNIVLTWPLSAANCSLQVITNIAGANSWVTLTNVPSIVNLQNSVTTPTLGCQGFYRLIQATQ